MIALALVVILKLLLIVIVILVARTAGTAGPSLVLRLSRELFPAGMLLFLLFMRLLIGAHLTHPPLQGVSEHIANTEQGENHNL